MVLQCDYKLRGRFEHAEFAEFLERHLLESQLPRDPYLRVAPNFPISNEALDTKT